MKGFGWLVGAALLARALPAGACWVQPEPGSFGSSLPETGGVLPANTALLLMGWRLGPEGLAATLDGQPVAILRSDLPFDPGQGRLAIGFEPAPAPGQHLQLSGTVCSPRDPAFPSDADYINGIDETACDVALDLEIGAPWQQPPLAVSTLRLDVFDHSSDDPKQVPGCADPSTIDYELRVTLDDSGGQLAPSAFVTAEFSSAKDRTWLGTTTMKAMPGEQTLTLSRWDLELGQDPCVRVTAWDASGQKSEPFESCGNDSCVYQDYSGKTTTSCNVSACSCRLADLGRREGPGALVPFIALCWLGGRRRRGRLGRADFLAQNPVTFGRR